MGRIAERFRLFNTVWDSRFEDLSRDTLFTTLYRDFSAGLIGAHGHSYGDGIRDRDGNAARAGHHRRSPGLYDRCAPGAGPSIRCMDQLQPLFL